MINGKDQEIITINKTGNSILNNAKYSADNTDEWYTTYETIAEECFLQALFPQKCRLNSSKLHGEFPHYCISSAGTLSGAGEEPLQAYKVY